MPSSGIFAAGRGLQQLWHCTIYVVAGLQLEGIVVIVAPSSGRFLVGGVVAIVARNTGFTDGRELQRLQCRFAVRRFLQMWHHLAAGLQWEGYFSN